MSIPADQFDAHLTNLRSTKLRSFVQSNVRPCIRLLRSRAQDTEIRVGASKLGGRPDLPPGLGWPRHRDRPLAFLAQISLADLPPCETNPFPQREGLLSFFYETTGGPWGFKAADRTAWRAMYIAGSDPLERRRPPSGKTKRRSVSEFSSTTVSFELAASLPPSGSDELENLSDSLAAAYYERVYDPLVTEPHSYPANVPRHQMFGHCCALQDGRIALGCLINSLGLASELGDDADPDEEEAVLDRAAQIQRDDPWELILQLDTDDRETGPGWIWGDAGTIYFYAPRSGIARGDLSATWTDLQSS